MSDKLDFNLIRRALEEAAEYGREYEIIARQNSITEARQFLDKGLDAVMGNLKTSIINSVSFEWGT